MGDVKAFYNEGAVEQHGSFKASMKLLEAANKKFSEKKAQMEQQFTQLDKEGGVVKFLEKYNKLERENAQFKARVAELEANQENHYAYEKELRRAVSKQEIEEADSVSPNGEFSEDFAERMWN